MMDDATGCCVKFALSFAAAATKLFQRLGKFEPPELELKLILLLT